MPLMPDTEGETALVGRERLGQEGQGERGHECGGHALDGAGADEEIDRGGQRRGGRAGGEQGDAGDEHALAPQPVTQRRAGQQQHRIGENVSVDGPLERLDRRAEVDPDARERDVHDEVVENHHEQAERDDHQGPDPVCGVRGGG
jgi:hypothetical protein